MALRTELVLLDIHGNFVTVSPGRYEMHLFDTLEQRAAVEKAKVAEKWEACGVGLKWVPMTPFDLNVQPKVSRISKEVTETTALIKKRHLTGRGFEPLRRTRRV